ncbi:hypothetical protein [Mycobacterium dioxanotrophicus]|uniref:hypothetical protein n=1 Tax=Mycobacterium dioxanotrophicus TaxID=482462 RepID=UPI001E3CF586|nr:hypothetical protein [Mycobacterium dioxanotrophicus]
MPIEVGGHPVDGDAIAEYVTRPVGVGESQYFLDLALDALHGFFDVGDRRFKGELHGDHLQRHHSCRRDVGVLPLQLTHELFVRAARHHPVEPVSTRDQLAFLDCLEALRVQLHKLRGLAEK